METLAIWHNRCSPHKNSWNQIARVCEAGRIFIDFRDTEGMETRWWTEGTKSVIHLEEHVE